MLIQSTRWKWNAMIALLFDIDHKGQDCSPEATLLASAHTTQLSSNTAHPLTFSLPFGVQTIFVGQRSALGSNHQEQEDSWGVWWGQLTAGWMLPPNNEVLCSLVKDCTNWEVFSKCSPVLKQTLEEKENYHAKRKEEISILSVAGLIFLWLLNVFSSSWYKLFLYSYWRKTGTSRGLRISPLLKTPLRMGSHTKKKHSGSRSFPFPPLAPQCTMESKPPGSCCQNLPTARPQTCRHHCAHINHYPYYSHGICTEQIRAWHEGWAPNTFLGDKDRFRVALAFLSHWPFTETEPVWIEITWYLSIKIHSFNLLSHFRILGHTFYLIFRLPR